MDACVNTADEPCMSEWKLGELWFVNPEFCWRVCAMWTTLWALQCISSLYHITWNSDEFCWRIVIYVTWWVCAEVSQCVLCAGLLKDSLRKYWLEQIRGMEASKAKAVNKTAREQADLDSVCTLSHLFFDLISEHLLCAADGVHKCCPLCSWSGQIVYGDCLSHVLQQASLLHLLRVQVILLSKFYGSSSIWLHAVSLVQITTSIISRTFVITDHRIHPELTAVEMSAIVGGICKSCSGDPDVVLSQ